MTDRTPDLITKGELARRLDCSKRTLSNYVETGVLPVPGRQGRDSVWRLSELRAMADAPPLPLRLQQRQREALLARLEYSDKEGAAPLATPPEMPRGIRTGISLSRHAPPTRPELLAEIVGLKALVRCLMKERRQEPRDSPLRDELMKQLRGLHEQREFLEAEVERSFMPGHSGDQLLLPYEFLCSPLFAACSYSRERSDCVELELQVNGKACATYVGPELRQDDALLLAALVNLTQDYRVGSQVGFAAEGLCDALWGHYNGPNRARLAQGIDRLTRAKVRYPDLSFALVAEFSAEARGPWRIRLDPALLTLYGRARLTRLALPSRRQLRQGLTTWLYGYVLSQRTLIPTGIERLRQLCGSVAQARSFRETLKQSLVELSAAGHIDAGWWLDGRAVRWRKPVGGAASGAATYPKDVEAQLRRGGVQGDFFLVGDVE